MITGSTFSFSSNSLNTLFQSTVKADGPIGSLGAFSTNISCESMPSDIARAAALGYHGDADLIYNPLLKRGLERTRKIRSKFAKRSADEEPDSWDPEVDEVTKEEKAPNDTKKQGRSNVQIARAIMINTVWR